jgi:hypothetical protein
MRTPAGTECPYYFEDFHRGRNKQECRLIDGTPNGGRWQPDLCSRCPVSRITLANACSNLLLRARARHGVLGIGRRVDVQAACVLSQEDVAVPEIGCGRCHEAFEVSIPPGEET